MNQYNDYELLYLMNEFDEDAERLLYEKYSNLIRNRIVKFNIKERYRDDFFQEGLYMLFIATRTYNENCKKTFNKYFDLILQRKFIRLITRERHYYFDVDLQDGDTIVNESYTFEYNFHSNCNFNSFEEKIITLKNKNYRPKEIAKILNCDVKRIYNCLYRIKTKK